MNGELKRIKKRGNDLLPGNILDFQEKEEYPLDQGRDVTGVWGDIIKKLISNLSQIRLGRPHHSR